MLSCRTDNKIEGTWIGAYSYRSSDSIKPYSIIRSIITFDDDSYYIHDNAYNNVTFYHEGKYNLNLDTLKFTEGKKKEEIIIKSINPDSLTFTSPDGILIVYKKLKSNLKTVKKTHLIGKIYLSESKFKRDTISFINDSIYLTKNGKLKPTRKYWNKISHQGYEIIFLDYLSPPYIIQHKKNDSIILTAVHKFEYSWHMKKLNKNVW